MQLMNYPQITLLNIFIYNIASLLFLIPYIANKNIANKNNKFTWILLLLLCLYGVYAGDWIHYKDTLLYYEYYGETGLEDIYDHIVSITGNNYLLFRLIIWGGALIVLHALFYRLPINRFRVLGFYAIWGILFFAYARVSLGLALFFYGFSFFVYPFRRHKTIGRIFGGICLISSFFCHKSIIVLCLLFPFAFISLSRKKIILLFVLGLASVSALNWLVQYIDILIVGIEGIEHFKQEARSQPLGQFLVGISNKIPLFLLFFYLMYKLQWKHRIQMLPLFIQRYFTLVIYIVLLSLIFYFSNIESKVLYYRTLYMSFIPLAIILSSAYDFLSKKILVYLTIAAYIGGNMLLSYAFLGHLNGSIQ